MAEAVQDGELWNLWNLWNLWYTNMPEPPKMRAEIDRRLGLQALGSMLPFQSSSPLDARSA